MLCRLEALEYGIVAERYDKHNIFVRRSFQATMQYLQASCLRVHKKINVLHSRLEALINGIVAERYDKQR
ncbi:MAG: hypothetical protein IPK35_17970 [Saprospiraceae bacterium]|jgi:hypothetical protein|nr:hypothetical protein [Saprospiraceae bacterium]